MAQVQELLGRLSRAALFGGAVAALVVITGLAYVGGPAIGLPIFYILPVAAVAWFGSRALGIATAALAALFWLGLDVVPQYGLLHGIDVWNAMIRAAALVSLAHFLAGSGTALRYARTDYLTGLSNSRAFYDAAQLESRRAQRYGGAFTLMYLDVDDLRAVNERFGHPVGDALLRSVATTLRTRMRSTDVVARLGADHYAILLPETDAEAAHGVLRKLEAVLTAISEKGPWTSGFSLGAATFMLPPESIEGALNRAEDLMYAARRAPAGTGRVRCLAESVPPGAPASDVEQAL
jgi:diguanylate cyclase (GGDEF)-like protein